MAEVSQPIEPLVDTLINKPSQRPHGLPAKKVNPADFLHKYVKLWFGIRKYSERKSWKSVSRVTELFRVCRQLFRLRIHHPGHRSPGHATRDAPGLPLWIKGFNTTNDLRAVLQPSVRENPCALSETSSRRTQQDGDGKRATALLHGLPHHFHALV